MSKRWFLWLGAAWLTYQLNQRSIKYLLDKLSSYCRLFFKSPIYHAKWTQQGIQLIDVDHQQALELYHLGYGKGSLSRGAPTWKKRHLEHEPDSLAEARRWEMGKKPWVDSNMEDKEVFLLMPEEAKFLVDQGLLHVDSLPDNNVSDAISLPDNNVSDMIDSTVSQVETVNLGWQHQVDPDRYSVYCHYKQQGWIVRCGALYGFDFVLYSAHPSKVHSSHLVWVTREWSMDQLLGRQRVAQQVKKVLLICRINQGVQAIQVERFIV